LGFRTDLILLFGEVMITSYRDLEAWKLSMVLAEAIYAVTQRFPREERYGLRLQLRRAAVGIPSNVSEGHQHGSRACRHYIIMALGCHAECETQLELARRLKLAPEESIVPVMELAARVGRILHGLARSLPQ
jgi:four helix bundle protein